jgi:protein-tyrosine phosphatase
VPNKFQPNIVYKKINLFDDENEDIEKYFNQSFEFIENALKNKKNSVLVHCNAGVSRSSAFVIAYLLQKGIFKNFKDAFDHVKKCRPIISPNSGFIEQLIQLEKKINLG